MSDLKEQFEEAVKFVRTATGDFKPSQDLQLEMYTLFKQSTEGNIYGKNQGFLIFLEEPSMKHGKSSRGCLKKKPWKSMLVK